MRIKRKKPKGKYQVKKFPHGGTHSEGELPEEGTMMGDLLRMLEQFKPEYRYKAVSDQETGRNLVGLRMFGSEEQNKLIDDLLKSTIYQKEPYRKLRYGDKGYGEDILEMANNPQLMYTDEERAKKKIEGTLYGFYDSLTEEQKAKVEESMPMIKARYEEGEIPILSIDESLVEQYSGEATNPMEDPGFRRFVKRYGPVTGQNPFKQSEDFFDFTYSPSVTRTGTEGEFTREGFGYSRTIQTLTNQIEQGRSEDGSLSRGDLINAKELGLDENATSEELAKAIANFKATKQVPVRLPRSEFLDESSPVFKYPYADPRRGGILGEYTNYISDEIRLPKLNVQLPEVKTHEESHSRDDFNVDRIKLKEDYGLDYEDFDDSLHKGNYTRLYTDASRELINDLRKDFEKKNPNHPSFMSRSPQKMFYNYVASITETMARINQIRGKLGIYDRDYTLEDLNKLRRHKGTQSDPLGDLRQAYTDEGIIEMLNKVYKKGGFIPKKKKQGGKITLLKK